MRFHCSVCGKDFTTLSKEVDSPSFNNLIFENMRCPNCGATNRQTKLKPLPKTRSRWQPKRRSRDTDEITQPITLSEICRKRLAVSFGNKISMKVVCDGCPSAFNCLSGNVDDGLVDNVSIEEKEEVKAKEVAKSVEEAKVKVVDTTIKDEESRLKRLVVDFNKQGFNYLRQNGQLCARFRGTVWKLDDEDKTAILEQSWHTPKTSAIKNTLTNHNLQPSLAREVLNWGLSDKSLGA